MTSLTEAQIRRYNRNILLPQLGIEGQQKLLKSRVLIIGAGGLGSPVALYLAAAGVGTIGIADADTVELSNLQRQVIHGTGNIGRAKVESAAAKMRDINPDCAVKSYREWISAANIGNIIGEGYEFVVDATDNFDTKFLINDACMQAAVAFSHGGVSGFCGQTMTVIPGKSACYRCVFSAPPPPEAVPTTATVGILGSIAGILGTVQATEAIKYLCGAGTLLSDTLLTFDGLSMDFRKVGVRKRPACPACMSADLQTDQSDD